MQEDYQYDIAIAGGGLAGLALSIQLAGKGYSVIVLEKETYPFHRVCGEYISLESWDFLIRLGLDLPAMDISRINRLQVSSLKGKLIEQGLPLGGFGISRYCLDHQLAQIARSAGVIIQEHTKVTDILFDQPGFFIETSKGPYRASVACGSYGKRTNLDIKWKRSFITTTKNKLNNYIGVKYHIRTNFPADTIALHNFKNGYCGIVKIEEDKYCCCYLTTAAMLQQAGGIQQLEQAVLSQNPRLKKILEGAERIFKEPVTISQISFDKKSQVEDHVLMVGDAAGMITPLCGNGMSMALHASKLAAEQIHLFLQQQITRKEMELGYSRQWQQQFARRLRMGRRIQRLFGSGRLTNLFIAFVKPFPSLINFLIKQTHGKPF